MKKRSILITGCSTGIGYDAAHELHKRGWRVFATCRSEDDCKTLRSEGLESFRLDYSDEQSIKTALHECLERTGGTLDAVFNNGAYAIPGFAVDYTRDALRDIFEANFFGHFDLINQIAPFMLKQGHGRIINCSSVLGLVAMRGRGSYNATKFALEGMTDTMRLEMRDTPIDVILIEPGPITTPFRKNAKLQFEKWIDWESSNFREQYQNELMPRLYEEPETKSFGELPASAVTKALIHSLESKRPRAHYYVTKPTYIVAFLRRLLPARALDAFINRF